MKVKRNLVVSDAGPLIQLAISDHLYILPRLYNVVIPEEVFEETQYYSDLPDAIEIAKTTRSWLKVRKVKRERGKASPRAEIWQGRGSSNTSLQADKS